MARLASKHQNVTTFNVTDLRGGMNVQAAPDRLEENEAELIDNFEFDIDGEKLTTRGGLSAPLITFADNILGVFYDYEMNCFLVFLENKDIYKYTTSYDPLLLGKLVGNEKPTCCKYGGAVMIASGDKLQTYDYSTGLTTITGSPMCDDVSERFGRVTATVTGDDNVYYAAVGDPTTWTDDANDDSDGWLTPVGYKDGGDIVGIEELSTDIIVFKNNGKIFQLTGEPPDQSLYKIASDSDFLYRKGITYNGKDLIYMSRVGLRSLSTSSDYGNFQNHEFGEKINPALISEPYHPTIWSLPRKKQFILRPKLSTKLYVYHYLTGGFTTMTFPQIVTEIVESPTEHLIAMGNSLYSWSKSYSTDNGTAIMATIKTRTKKSIQNILVKRLAASISSTTAGNSTVKVNGHALTFGWTETNQELDTRLVLTDKELGIEFSTTSPITFNHIILETALL